MADISVHRTNIEGQVAEAAAVAGNPVLMGGDDGTDSRFVQMRTEDDSIVAGDIHLTTVGLFYGYNGAAWERVATDGAGGLSPPYKEASGTLTAVDQSVTLNVAGYSWVAVRISGTWVATVGWDVSVDGSSFESSAGFDEDGDLLGESTTITRRVVYVPCGGAEEVQIYSDVYTSGTVDVAMRAVQNGVIPMDMIGDNDAIPASESRRINIGLLYGYDGTDWGRVQLEVDDDVVPGGETHLTTIGLLHGYDGTQWERLQTNAAGALDINGTGIGVVGNAAHDAAASGNPVLVAARANLNEPDDDVSADDDVVTLWADRFGRLVTVGGHSNPVDPAYVNATASGDTEILAAPGASVSLYINRILITNGGASVNNVQLQVDGTAVNRGPGDLAADGGGAVLDFGQRGWKIAANTALDVNLGSAGDVHVTVLEHYIAA